MTRDREPLTPEERDLAERLAGTALRAQPAPALDARILAAARAAAGGGSGGAGARGRRFPRRWPATLGIAASLALALGIAWQLRPLPEPMPNAPRAPAPAPTSDAAVSARSVAAPQPDAAEVRAAPLQEADAPLDPQPAHAEASPSVAPSKPGQPRTMALPEAETGPARAHEEQRRASAERAVELRVLGGHGDEAAPPQAPAPPPAPPAPPAPAAQSRAESSSLAAPVASDQRAPAPAAVPTDTDTAIGRERMRGAPAPATTVIPAAAPVSGIRPPAPEEADLLHDQPLDEAPPATADSPHVHRAWLARIRELRDEGEHEAARESLREFHRRHPEVELPEDLAGLLDP